MRVLTAAATVPVAAAVWGVGIERYLFTVRRHEVQVLPPGSAPMRMLHVSDLHMAPWQHRKQAFVASLADSLQPDLVVNTGDNLGHRDGLVGIRRAFAPLRGVPGVFVHGSNDVSGPSPRNPLRYFLGPSRRKRREEHLDTAALDRFLTDDLGWHGIDNAAVAFDAAGLRIRAFGVGDAHRRWDDLTALPAAIAALPSDPDLTIGVTHAPYRRVLDRFVELGAQLILGGHTHGGQVRIPFDRRALVANCDIPLDQARGLSDWEGIPLNVSAGLGHSIYAPVRFACRPEVSLLTLLPRSGPEGTPG